MCRDKTEKYIQFQMANLKERIYFGSLLMADIKMAFGETAWTELI
jgi:hypothetical protein